ncbi:Hypothetical protein POVN_LOCUS54, partial [uncultured virus]
VRNTKAYGNVYLNPGKYTAVKLTTDTEHPMSFRGQGPQSYVDGFILAGKLNKNFSAMHINRTTVDGDNALLNYNNVTYGTADSDTPIVLRGCTKVHYNKVRFNQGKHCIIVEKGCHHITFDSCQFASRHPKVYVAPGAEAIIYTHGSRFNGPIVQNNGGKASIYADSSLVEGPPAVGDKVLIDAVRPLTLKEADSLPSQAQAGLAGAVGSAASSVVSGVGEVAGGLVGAAGAGLAALGAGLSALGEDITPGNGTPTNGTPTNGTPVAPVVPVVPGTNGNGQPLATGTATTVDATSNTPLLVSTTATVVVVRPGHRRGVHNKFAVVLPVAASTGGSVVIVRNMAPFSILVKSGSGIFNEKKADAVVPGNGARTFVLAQGGWYTA